MREGTFVLVHGAWHGAWCWERLVPELEAHGHTTIEVDLPAEDPEAGLTRYAELTAAAMGDADDVVVVGHSLGAATIPLVASLRPVRHLVFLCGLVPKPGRSVTDRYGEDVFVPGFVGNTGTREDGASFWPDPSAAKRCFYHDCTDDDAEWAVHVRPLPRRAVHSTRLVASRFARAAGRGAARARRRPFAVRLATRGARRAARPTRLSRPDFACSPTGLP